MRPTGILETAIYATDLHAMKQFYTQVLNLEVIDDEPPHHLFLRCEQSMFLIFNPEESAQQNMEIGGTEIPRHGATGPSHMAFRVPDEEIESWKKQLQDHQIEIEAEINWPRGGRSLYVRDPAGNSIEFASPRLWGFSQ